jgi:hypothetical protein
MSEETQDQTKRVTLEEALEVFQKGDDPKRMQDLGISLAAHAHQVEDRLVNAHQAIQEMQKLLKRLVKCMSASAIALHKDASFATAHQVSRDLRDELLALRGVAENKPAQRAPLIVVPGGNG